MNRYAEIREMKSVFETKWIDKFFKENPSCTGLHASLQPYYHIVSEVIWLLEKETPPEVILKIIDLMKGL